MSLSAQYSTSANLAARISLHQQCSVNPQGLQRWIFDRLALAPGMRVLEIACGTGSLWRENADRIPPGLDLVLSDFSLGMLVLDHAARDARFVACAMPDLPFVDEHFDLVVANHMLYHVNDRERGLRDIHRVLRPGGMFFATTNGEAHLREIKELMSRFDIEIGEISASFTLENGEDQVRRVFANVRREDHDDALRITDPALLLGYIASVSPFASEVVARRGDEMRDAIDDRIAREGSFYVIKSTGAFAARKA